ncbi:MAG: cation transporter [Chloroflexi bacterium]|nr:cation transporter [Chloroflexota bacterium]
MNQSDISYIRQRASWISLTVGISLLFLKFGAYVMTDSTAVLSDALESIINVVAASFAVFSVWQSSRPPDERYPYGYGKIEFFSSGFEGALIFVAAIGILVTAIPQLFAPKVLHQLDIGLILLIFGGVANYLLGLYLIRTGHQVHSDTLIADGYHVRTDVVTSAGVVVGLILVRITGWAVLDPAIACLVALNILFTGWRLVGSSIANLMDRAEPTFLELLTQALTRMRMPGWIAPHRLRSWRSGALRYIDFHLVLPRFWDLTQAHSVSITIEHGLADVLDEELQIIIHMDPCSSIHCHVCDLPDCTLREAAFEQDIAWSQIEFISGPPPPLQEELWEQHLGTVQK